jgi:hypothetical protein
MHGGFMDGTSAQATAKAQRVKAKGRNKCTEVMALRT